MKNNRLINALLRKPVDKTPIWVMRQAGRYLPEYRELRAKTGDFLTLCKTPELACEVTLQPLRRFDLDAAIIFSDILTIPDAMDLGLHFVEGEGPQFRRPIRNAKDINQLSVPNVEEKLSYVTDAIKHVKHELNDAVPLIGFAGSPWTLACYMIEGGPSKNYQTIKKMLYNEPQLLHNLLDKLTQSTIAYLNAQIDAGADAIMIFDTWGGILTPEAYQHFSLAYMKTIIAGIHKQRNGQTIPNIIFTKNGGQWLETMLDANSNALGLDWTINIDTARERVGDTVALQGNLDPSILLAQPEQIRHHAEQILTRFGAHPGHVFNLGHGITPNVPPEHVEVLVNHVHEFSAQFHTAAASAT